MIYLERHAPALHMHRYYTLAVAPNLFNEWSLVRAWGRVGQPPQSCIELHATEQDARSAMQRWAERKKRKGYE